MMETTLAWPLGASTNRRVGRGLWSWIDLIDPDDGPVVLAGTTGQQYWPFRGDAVTHVDNVHELTRALKVGPTMIVADERFLDDDPDLVPALVAAVANGAAIVIGESVASRPVLGKRWLGRSAVLTGSAIPEERPTRGLARLAESLDAAVARLVPAAGGAEARATGSPPGSGPSVLMLPDISELLGPSLHRWRGEVGGTVRAPLAVLPRAWQAIPNSASTLLADVAGLPSGGASEVPPLVWEFGPPRGYATQKSVLFVGGSKPTVVKQSRHDLGARRLAAEADALHRVAILGCCDASASDDPVSVPSVLGESRRPGRTVVVESSLAGPSLHDLVGEDDFDRGASALVEFLVQLGASSARPADAEQQAIAFDTLADRFAGTFPFHRRLQRRVRVAARRIQSVGTPSVFFHGDFTPWNLVRVGNRWAVHDWENADSEGPPVWDLMLLAIGIVDAVDRRPSVRHLAERLTTPGTFHEQLTAWTDRYCREVGVDPRLIPELWVTGLAHEATKEASRASITRRFVGRSVRVLSHLQPDHLPGAHTG